MKPLLLLLLTLLTPSESSQNFRLALHAQAAPTPELIVGSVLTTNGLAAAYKNINPQGTPPRIFYPFNYNNLKGGGCYDLVIIEGYFQMITSFIHEVRRGCPNGVVLFWSLDPDFVPRETLMSFDFDGILTNSEELKSFLETFIPTRYLPLAADTEKFSPHSAIDDENDKKREVVFVGSAGAILAGSKVYLTEVLRSTVLAIDKINSQTGSELELVIYGKAWEKLPEFSEYHRGVLPIDSLPAVYAQALAVIGNTMDSQREAGMINNRVYEVLSSGTPLISDWFEALENLFGNLIK